MHKIPIFFSLGKFPAFLKNGLFRSSNIDVKMAFPVTPEHEDFYQSFSLVLQHLKTVNIAIN